MEMEATISTVFYCHGAIRNVFETRILFMRWLNIFIRCFMTMGLKVRFTIFVYWKRRMVGVGGMMLVEVLYFCCSFMRC